MIKDTGFCGNFYKLLSKKAKEKFSLTNWGWACSYDVLEKQWKFDPRWPEFAKSIILIVSWGRHIQRFYCLIKAGASCAGNLASIEAETNTFGVFIVSGS